MLASRSISITHSHGMLEKFLHGGEALSGVEMQTSISTLKSNLMLSCKVEYLHSLQLLQAYCCKLGSMHRNVPTFHSCHTNIPSYLRWAHIQHHCDHTLNSKYLWQIPLIDLNRLSRQSTLSLIILFNPAPQSTTPNQLES